jgi:hypothetical protein
MKVIPLTLDEANAFVRDFHRHNKPVRGGRFFLGAEVDGELMGVVIVGRTTARLLHSATTAEVTRLCTKPAAPKNTCSFLYAAARRAWMAQGGERLVTYTLQSEGGASLRAAGWTKAATIEGEQWGRQNRPREDQPVCIEPKFRWEASSTPK